jgi:hypothetical protein
MHRTICGLERGDGRYVDHLNHDKLDNRRANLRVVSNAENVRNRAPRVYGSSRFRGVSFCKRTGRWVAQVTIGGHNHFLGRHVTEEQAAQAAESFRVANGFLPTALWGTPVLTDPDADRAIPRGVSRDEASALA